MGVETAGAPPGGFFQRKKCSTQRILCQVYDGNHSGAPLCLKYRSRTFLKRKAIALLFQVLSLKILDLLTLCLGRPVMVLLDRRAV